MFLLLLEQTIFHFNPFNLGQKSDSAVTVKSRLSALDLYNFIRILQYICLCSMNLVCNIFLLIGSSRKKKRRLTQGSESKDTDDVNKPADKSISEVVST